VLYYYPDVLSLNISIVAMFKYATALVLGTLAASALGHMNINEPCIRGSQLPDCNAPNPDPDNIKSPIGSFNTEVYPLCHGSTPYPEPVATIKAGEPFPVHFRQDGATHGGGHCEFSLSYDGGNTFVALQTILRNCLTGDSPFDYNVPIPEDLPSGDKVIFAWTWVNAIGNREFYMNCADVAVEGKPDGTLVGPEIVIANYYPGGPSIAEFSSGDDGSYLYTERPNVTVTASGVANSGAPSA